MRTVLIVDDEHAFRLSLADGLSVYADRFKVLSAEDGKKAVAALESQPIDLVVTDLKMPEMDGFELLAYLSRNHPDVAVIVMTAYGTPEIDQRLQPFGIDRCLDKPIDFKELAGRILEELEATSQGYFQGFPLPTFLQLLGLEKKSCTIKVASGERAGTLWFLKGELIAAECGQQRGVEAAYEVLGWEGASIELARANRLKARDIADPLNHVLMEAFRLKDEQARALARGERAKAGGEGTAEEISVEPTQLSKEAIMALEQHLRGLKEIKGFKAAGIMNHTGETLAADSIDPNIDLALVGATFNDIFRSAHDASIKIGLEACKETVISTPKGVVVMRCSGVDAKVHFHVIAVLAADGNQALAKMQVEKLVPAIMHELG